MPKAYYSEQTMENIARRVLNAFDGRLYTGKPCAIPIENIIEWHGLIMEFQYIRKNGRILGQTIFDTGLEAVYDMERMEYTLFPVKAGTLHKGLYTGTGESAALRPAIRETDMEIQANMLGSALLMPIAMVKRCFYQLRSGRDDQTLVRDMAEVFQVSRQAMRIRLQNHHLI